MTNSRPSYQNTDHSDRKKLQRLGFIQKVGNYKGICYISLQNGFFLQKYHITGLCCPSTILYKHCFQFPSVGLTIAPRKFENNVYAKC